MINCKSIRKNSLDRFYLDGLYVNRNFGSTPRDRGLGLCCNRFQLGLDWCCPFFVDGPGSLSLFVTPLIPCLKVPLASFEKYAANLNKYYFCPKNTKYVASFITGIFSFSSTVCEF